MSKAAMKRHAAFRMEVVKRLLPFNSKVLLDDDHTLQIMVDTKRIGPLLFTMFKRDGEDERRGDGLYSLFCQLPTKEQVEKYAPLVNLVFGQGIIHVMNPFSGKWNIHFYDVKDVLNELDERLNWLSKKHNDVYSASLNS